MNGRPRTAETIVRNLRMLMREWPMEIDDLAKKSKVTRRMIQYVLNGERKPSVEITDKLAGAFGCTGWVLMLPGLTTETVRSGRVGKFVENYAHSPKATRDYLYTVAERDAQYDAANDDEPDDTPPRTPTIKTTGEDKSRQTIRSRNAGRGRARGTR